MRQIKPRLRQMALAGLFALSPTVAFAASFLDGSLGGVNPQRETAQVIITGSSVIGFYWHGDYMDATSAKFSQDGWQVDFNFTQGSASLKRKGSGAQITIQESGKDISTFNLKKD